MESKLFTVYSVKNVYMYTLYVNVTARLTHSMEVAAGEAVLELVHRRELRVDREGRMPSHDTSPFPRLVLSCIDADRNEK